MKDRWGVVSVVAVAVTFLLATGGSGPAVATQSQTAMEAIDPASLELSHLSPGFLGVYRKVMEIEDRIREQTEKYGLDYDLARAVCLYESGGNARLTSWAGAEGYFQVMPATQRMLGVDDNIEAGIKYLAQLVERFEREDYALAGYNGGPGTVGRSRPMRLESLQYVIGVGHYRMMLKLYEEPIRRHAAALQIEVAREDDTWWSVAQRLGIPLLQLRMYNPYIAVREMKPGYLVVHPRTPRADLYEVREDAIYYRSRVGDNYFGIAFAFDVPLDAVRAENRLWHLQTLPPGMELRLPLSWQAKVADGEQAPVARPTAEHVLAEGETIDDLATKYETTAWRLIRDNHLWSEQLPAAGTTIGVALEPAKPQFTAHTVRSGETLTIIANRYGTSVREIQDANGMGGGTVIRIGQQLRVPATR